MTPKSLRLTILKISACYESSLNFQSAFGFVIRGCINRQAKAFAGPGTKILAFATFAAKRSRRVAGRIQARPLAARANHHFGCRKVWFHHSWVANARRWTSAAQAQSVSSNEASPAQACSRSSLSCRIMRTDTIRRLPLISGISPSDGSRRRRKS